MAMRDAFCFFVFWMISTPTLVVSISCYNCTGFKTACQTDNCEGETCSLSITVDPGGSSMFLSTCSNEVPTEGCTSDHFSGSDRILCACYSDFCNKPTHPFPIIQSVVCINCYECLTSATTCKSGNCVGETCATVVTSYFGGDPTATATCSDVKAADGCTSSHFKGYDLKICSCNIDFCNSAALQSTNITITLTIVLLLHLLL